MRNHEALLLSTRLFQRWNLNDKCQKMPTLPRPYGRGFRSEVWHIKYPTKVGYFLFAVTVGGTLNRQHGLATAILIGLYENWGEYTKKTLIRLMCLLSRRRSTNLVQNLLNLLSLVTFEPDRRTEAPVEAIRAARRSSARRSDEIPRFFLIVFAFVILSLL